MARTKRAQVLMEPEEYRRLETLARERSVSVAELIRVAVREKYLEGVAQAARRKAVRDFLATRIPLDFGEWEDVEREIEESYERGLS